MRKVKWLVPGTHLQTGGDLSIRPLLVVFHVCIPIGLGGKFRLSVLSHAVVASWPIRDHWCDVHFPLSPKMLLSLTWGILALYAMNHSHPPGFVAFGFGYSLPASQVMKGMNIQALIVELSLAVLSDISLETEGWSSYWNPGFKVVELLVFFWVTSITTQNNSHPLSILFWGLIIDCLGSNLHFINLLHSASISLSVNWRNNSTSLIWFLCRLNELIFIKELEQYSVSHSVMLL